jgi:hypothetical protein
MKLDWHSRCKDLKLDWDCHGGIVFCFTTLFASQCVDRDSISLGFPGTLAVLWVLRSSVLVSRKIWFGTPNVPGFCMLEKYISHNAYEHADSLKIGESIYRIWTAIKQALRGRNRRGRGRCVDWSLESVAWDCEDQEWERRVESSELGVWVWVVVLVSNINKLLLISLIYELKVLFSNPPPATWLLLCVPVFGFYKTECLALAR